MGFKHGTLGFNVYQEKVGTFATYPLRGNNILYPAMGLAGESGEALDKVKKLWRNVGKTSGQDYTPTEKLELAKELGDVLWYISQAAFEIGYDLETIAELNITKLTDRNNRGVIKSEGDNR